MYISQMGGDMEKMVAIGLIWGATNAFMRRGALVWDQNLQSNPHPNSSKIHPILRTAKNWLNLLLIWQYSVPFFLNLSASASFFAILSETPISVAVPVTNATTFAATAAVGMLLGEETRVGLALFGDVHQLTGEGKAHCVMLVGPFHEQALVLKLRNLAMNSALLQSILTSPPLVAQLSAFHKLE